jgi:hypothetical protein
LVGVAGKGVTVGVRGSYVAVAILIFVSVGRDVSVGGDWASAAGQPDAIQPETRKARSASAASLLARSKDLTINNP